MCGAVGRENMWHTRFSCVVESKNRILVSNKSYNLIKMCMCVYGGWMMNSFLHMILSSPFEILRLGLCPFILLFLLVIYGGLVPVVRIKNQYQH
jgi:hypothetical protein